ncbi:MAG: hypothetical protein M1358_08450 [Chloroflexi bacterium]|nr:hypothetical protein [Chloroflexota bacterium]
MSTIKKHVMRFAAKLEGSREVQYNRMVSTQELTVHRLPELIRVMMIATERVFF